jgi:hypothetical protein
MASNTQILIKRSSANTKPTNGTIKAGELAYSYLSNTLFIGTNDGASTLEIGAWSDLTNLSNGTYGSTTAVPVITVDSHGKVTNVYTQAIATSFNISDGTHSNTVAGGTTLTFSANNNFGIQTYVDPASETVYIGLDNTRVILANTTANQTIDGVLNISGDLNVTGNISYTDVETIISQNSLIKLANNNVLSDVVDIGFYGESNNGAGITYTGLFRHAGDSGKDYYLFDNYTKEDPDTTFVIDPTDPSFKVSTLHANLISQNVHSTRFLADESVDTSGGYGFYQDGSQDTGMYSSGDGNLEFKSNGANNFTIASSSFSHHTDVTLQHGATLGDNSDNAVYFGLDAGTTGNNTVSIGSSAGTSSQGSGAVAVGHGAGNDNQGTLSVAVGVHAAEQSQQSGATAVGHSAGQVNQQSDATAVGNLAGKNTQGTRATAVGYRAGYGDTTSQGQDSVAIGSYAGYDSQVQNSIAINASGNHLNPSAAGFYVDPIRANNAVGGYVTAYNTTTKELVSTDVVIDNGGITLANGTIISDSSVGGLYVDSLNYGETNNVVFYNVSTKQVTFGSMADLRPDMISNGAFSWTVSGDDGHLYSDRGTQIADSANSVVIGQNVDVTNNNQGRVAIGEYAGATSQQEHAVAIGSYAGNNTQSTSAIAIGEAAGQTTQGFSAIALGRWAGETNQGSDAIAIGRLAGANTQSSYAVSLGHHAGRGTATAQGAYSVAIGAFAAEASQVDNSIVISASGSALNPTYAGLYIDPIRYTAAQDATYDGIAFYNASTKEVRYSYVLDGGSF